MLAALPQPPELHVALADAVGCVVSADVIAPDAVPAVAVAAFDGYALRSSDTASPGQAAFPVTHDVVPGGAPTRLLARSAARIAKGGALPFGADAVVATVTAEPRTVAVNARVVPGVGVVPAGFDAAAGERLVAEGTVLGVGHVAALAACGIASVRVRPAPRVVIIVTGSELWPVAETLHASQRPHEPTQDATGIMLSSMVHAAGGRVVRLVSVADDAAALRRAVDDAALQAELILTVGGTSDDWHDVVIPVLDHALGVEFEHVRLAGGSRHGVGSIMNDRGWPAAVLSLPGHPLDAAACFATYVDDAIAHIRGTAPARTRALILSQFDSPFGYAQVVPIKAVGGDRASVEAVGDAARPGLRDMALSEGIAIVDESVTRVSSGMPVEVYWWSM